MPNILLKTEQLTDDTTWVQDWADFTTDAAAAPVVYGANAGLADLIGDSYSAQLSNIQQTVTKDASTTGNYIASLHVKKDAVTTRFPRLSLRLVGTSTYDRSVQINTSTGAIGVPTDATAPDAYGVVDFDDLWWRVWMRVLDDVSATSARMQIYPAPAATLTGAVDYPPTGTIVIFGANIVQADALGEYQPHPWYFYYGPRTSGILIQQA